VQKLVVSTITPSKADDVSVDSSAIPTCQLQHTNASAYLASENMCDTHEVIINHICKMICWPAIGFEDNEIVFSTETRYLTITKDQVGRVIFSRTRLHISSN
jgi:hypothetical protein